jgi:glc operon protein GlcG
MQEVFMSRRWLQSLLVAVLALCAQGAMAQMPNPYGTNITAETAKKLAAAVLAEARKNDWRMAVAVVDTGGYLVYYEKMENTQLGSATVSIEKARSAVLYKRPGKAMEDAVAAGGAGIRMLRLTGAVPINGGLPLLVDGKIVGGLGVSGDTSDHDAQCAKAGADLLK